MPTRSFHLTDMKLERVFDVHVSGAHSLRVVGEAGPSGVRLSLEADCPHRMASTLELDLIRGYCALDGHRAEWPLWRGLPWVAGGGHDPFGEMVCRAEDALFDRDVTFDRVEARDSLHLLRQLARDLAIRAADRCDPASRRIALRFGATVRWLVYQLLVARPTSRMAQMATVAPGLFVMRAAFVRFCTLGVDGAPVRGGFEARVEGGEAPKEISDYMARMWLRDRAPGLQGSDWRSMLDVQSLLMRRASALVPPRYLWHRPPYAFVVEDIPQEPRKNAEWFVLIKCVTRHAAYANLDAKRRVGLSRFVSKSGLRLRRCMGKIPLERLASLLVAYGELTNRALNRASSVPKIASDLTRYRGELRRLERVNSARYSLAKSRWPDAAPVNEDTRLPVGPIKGAKDVELSVEPIATLGELIAEGVTMRNCVVGFAEAALRGERFFYRVTAERQRLTVMITPNPGGGATSEVKAHANRAPTPEARASVRAWIDAGLRRHPASTTIERATSNLGDLGRYRLLIEDGVWIAESLTTPAHASAETPEEAERKLFDAIEGWTGARPSRLVRVWETLDL